jgi:hypothetical protein
MVSNIKRRGRPLKYPTEKYGEVLSLRLKGMSMREIAKKTFLPKSTVYRMLERLGFS